MKPVRGYCHAGNIRSAVSPTSSGRLSEAQSAALCCGRAEFRPWGARGFTPGPLGKPEGDGDASPAVGLGVKPQFSGNRRSLLYLLSSFQISGCLPIPNAVMISLIHSPEKSMHPNHDQIKPLRKRLAVTILLLLLLLPLPLKAEEPSPLRLDRKVVPTAQAIDLILDAGRSDYTGAVRIDLQVNETTDSFRFHAEELKLTAVRLKRKRRAVPIRHERGEGGLVIVKGAKPFRKGSYTLEVRFSNRFNRQASALYKVETGGEAYLCTQFEALDDRKAFH